MSLFRNKYKYKTPERFTPAEARERRLSSLLEKEQRFQEVPNFARQLEAVRSQAQKERVKSLAKQIVNDEAPSRQKAALIAAALKTYSERDFSNPQARADYKKLRAAQAAIYNRRSSGKVPPSGGNKSYFNPTGKDYASTVYGTVARLSGWTNVVSENTWVPVFARPSAVLPCIQRVVRREVMFAKQHAGKGYHTKKRRNWSSGVPC